MFFDRPESGSHALLVHVDKENASAEEFTELTTSAGLVPVGQVVAHKRYPDPRTYFGSGKIEEIAAAADACEASLILFDEDLTPSQERNLEKGLGRRVLSRTGLILEIFAQRARTHEGKLQVELAQLEHASTRLVRGWTHLDRQRGGSGRGQGAAMGVTGAGETQLEADQRMLGQRIKYIQQRLGKVRNQRAQNRRSRERSDVRTVSLVGYTNAGKSTLFNRLCQSDVRSANQLFATLDPTLRQLNLPVIGKAVLTDTVGFIRQLPHSLVDAFRATLEEVSQADLLVHVVDASNPEHDEQMRQVNLVLEEIGAGDLPQLIVFNKIDLSGEIARMRSNGDGAPERVWASAVTGDGIELLTKSIAERLADSIVETTLQLAPHQGAVRAQLFELGAVLDEAARQDGTIDMRVRIERDRLDRICRQAGMLPLAV